RLHQGLEAVPDGRAAGENLLEGLERAARLGDVYVEALVLEEAGRLRHQHRAVVEVERGRKDDGERAGARGARAAAATGGDERSYPDDSRRFGCSAEDLAPGDRLRSHPLSVPARRGGRRPVTRKAASSRRQW